MKTTLFIARMTISYYYFLLPWPGICYVMVVQYGRSGTPYPTVFANN